MRIGMVILAWAVVAIILTYATDRYLAHMRVRRRLWQEDPSDSETDEPVEAFDQGWLDRWLFLAGFRRPTAKTNFLLATAGVLAVGLAVALLVRKSGIIALALAQAQEMPGGTGSLAQPVLQVAPWLVMAMLAVLPVSLVRAARRSRVAQVERDLPITLELLATLAESGIGFDAAMGRILDSQPSDRALATELRTLQAELLAGRSRVDCLRRVARRLDVVPVTIFISAIVQAEQIGSGVTVVLRSQADDLRQRRRERALEFSMVLPVKQLFPLVICFLPGILIFAIAPLFADFLRYTSSFGGLGR